MTSVAGTAALLRLALRRDRVSTSVWLVVLLALVAGSAGATVALYPTAADRAAFAASVSGNPTTVAIYGPGYDLRTVGGAATWKTVVLGAVLVWLLCSFVVVRHTRGEEADGRAELLRAGAVGRLAPLAAALLAASLAAVLAGAVTVIGLVGTGVPVGGSLVLGLGLVAIGLSAAVVAAVCAQLTESPRLATGAASAALAIAYGVRAVGDSRQSWVGYLSPIGWIVRLRPYGPTRWWVLALALAWVLLFGALAIIVAARRDLGAGLVAARPGPSRAAGTLRGTYGLVWRQQRAALLGWTVGFAVGGAAAGSVASSAGSLVGDNAATADLLRRLGGGHELSEAYLATVIGVLGLLASAYAIGAVLRVRGEETSGRAELLLVADGRRLRLAAAHVVVAGLGVVLLMGVAGLVAGLTHGRSEHEVGAQVPALLGACLAQVPADLVLAGLALAAVGLLPRAATGVWAVLAVFLLLGQLGAELRLPTALRDVSPYSHLPHLPGGTTHALPLLVLAVVALALTAAGLTGWRHRDVG